MVTLENMPLTSHVILGLVDLAGGGIHGPLLLEAFTQSEARTTWLSESHWQPSGPVCVVWWRGRCMYVYKKRESFTWHSDESDYGSKLCT